MPLLPFSELWRRRRVITICSVTADCTTEKRHFIGLPTLWTQHFPPGTLTTQETEAGRWHSRCICCPARNGQAVASDAASGLRSGWLVTLAQGRRTAGRPCSASQVWTFAERAAASKEWGCVRGSAYHESCLDGSVLSSHVSKASLFRTAKRPQTYPQSRHSLL